MIIVDDICMVAVGEDARQGYRLVDACYENRSLAVSSSLHPAGFDEIIPKTLATATIDRHLHHATSASPTARPTDSPKPPPGKGVMPYPPEPLGDPTSVLSTGGTVGQVLSVL